MTDFSAGAWIVGARTRHSREDDHSGTQTDLSVSLSASIGKYPGGMLLSDVLVDMASRLAALESGIHRVRTMTLDAFIQPHLRASAVIMRAGSSGSASADAVVTAGGRLSMGAMISAPAASSAHADAWIVWPV